MIYGLEVEREKFSSEANAMNSKYLEALEEVKLREPPSSTFRSRSRTESPSAQQQNLYEGVRADRNLYSKNLIEAQDEI